MTFVTLLALFFFATERSTLLPVLILFVVLLGLATMLAMAAGFVWSSLSDRDPG